MRERFFLFMAYWIMISMGLTGAACFVTWSTDVGNWPIGGRAFLLLLYVISGVVAGLLEEANNNATKLKLRRQAVFGSPYEQGVADTKKLVKLIPSITKGEKDQIDSLEVLPEEASLVSR